EIRGYHDLEPMRIDGDRGRALDRFCYRLEADPAAAEAREREAQQAIVEIFLHRRGIEDRHHRGDEVLLALMREGRGLAAVVVTGDRDDAAVGRRAGSIRML